MLLALTPLLASAFVAPIARLSSSAVVKSAANALEVGAVVPTRGSGVQMYDYYDRYDRDFYGPIGYDYDRYYDDYDRDFYGPVGYGGRYYDRGYDYDRGYGYGGRRARSYGGYGGYDRGYGGGYGYDRGYYNDRYYLNRQYGGRGYYSEEDDRYMYGSRSYFGAPDSVRDAHARRERRWRGLPRLA